MISHNLDSTSWLQKNPKDSKETTSHMPESMEACGYYFHRKLCNYRQGLGRLLNCSEIESVRNMPATR